MVEGCHDRSILWRIVCTGSCVAIAGSTLAAPRTNGFVAAPRTNGFVAAPRTNGFVTAPRTNGFVAASRTNPLVAPQRTNLFIYLRQNLRRDLRELTPNLRRTMLTGVCASNCQNLFKNTIEISSNGIYETHHVPSPQCRAAVPRSNVLSLR